MPQVAFKLKKITEGCVSITWLIPVPFVECLLEAIRSTSSEFFKEQKIETVTISGQECYPSLLTKYEDYLSSTPAIQAAMSDEMFVMPDNSWTPLDFYVTGHAISRSNCPWRLEFSDFAAADDDDDDNHGNNLLPLFDDEKFELFCKGCANYVGNRCRGYISYANFGGNDITSKSMQAFLNIPIHILQGMEWLLMDHNRLDGSACDLLAIIISSMSRLEGLQLSSNKIGIGGAVNVISALFGSALKQLWLQNTDIGVPDCEALCKQMKSSQSLEYLNIAKNHLSSESLDSILTGLSHISSLIELDISNSHFSMANIMVLASVLRDNSKFTLALLGLRDCQISNKGAVELAAALCTNSTLQTLYLDDNPIGVEGAFSISDMLQHNTSLEDLFLCDDSVGEVGVCQLIHALKHNRTLDQLWLPNKYLSETSDQRIFWL